MQQAIIDKGLQCSVMDPPRFYLSEAGILQQDVPPDHVDARLSRDWAK